MRINNQHGHGINKIYKNINYVASNLTKCPNLSLTKKVSQDT